MHTKQVKTGVVCGSYGLLSNSLNELDKMIKHKQIPPSFTLLRRDGRRIDVTNKDVKFDLINNIFKHSFFAPDFVLVIEGLFADQRTRGCHTLTDQQIEFLSKVSRLPFDITPAVDICNYKLNICEEAEDIILKHTIEEFAIRNLEKQIQKEFSLGIMAAPNLDQCINQEFSYHLREKAVNPMILNRLINLINENGIDAEQLTEEQVQILYQTLEKDYESSNYQ